MIARDSLHHLHHLFGPIRLLLPICLSVVRYLYLSSIVDTG